MIREGRLGFTVIEDKQSRLLKGEEFVEVLIGQKTKRGIRLNSIVVTKPLST